MSGFFSIIGLTVLCLIAPLSSFPTLPETVDADGQEWIGPLRRCPHGSDEGLDQCTKKIVQDLTSQVGAGIPALGVPPLDPLKMDKFAFEQTVGPVSIKVLTKNIEIRDFVKYDKLKFNVDTTKRVMSFVYEAPMIRVNGNYKLGGNAFFFPLTGSGPAAIELRNLRVVGRMIFGNVEREDGVTVVQLSETIMDEMTVGDMKVRIRGLFDGNPMISGMIHYVANQYGSQVFEVVRPEISSYASEFLTTNVLNPALSKLPHLAAYVP